MLARAVCRHQTLFQVYWPEDFVIAVIRSGPLQGGISTGIGGRYIASETTGLRDCRQKCGEVFQVAGLVGPCCVWFCIGLALVPVPYLMTNSASISLANEIGRCGRSCRLIARNRAAGLQRLIL